jgi:leader peptidase (prepilin peptidase) / N-methyltransferase
MLIIVAAAAAGLLLAPRLIGRGMSQLGPLGPLNRRFDPGSRLAVGAAGAAAVMAADRADEWWLLPALLTWAYVLAAAASCDAIAQRIPTALVRQGAVAAGVLLVGGSAIAGDRRGVVTAALAAVAGGLVLGFCWEFAGAGLGDVRLAVLGGLGLGHVTLLGLACGVAAFAGITIGQVGIALVRGRSRGSRFPMGPALATGFLLAAAV